MNLTAADIVPNTFRITNVDISGIVIEQMKKTYPPNREKFMWNVLDITKPMPKKWHEKFDFVFEKSLADALCFEPNAQKQREIVNGMFNEILSCLKDWGIFVVFTIDGAQILSKIGYDPNHGKVWSKIPQLKLVENFRIPVSYKADQPDHFRSQFCDVLVFRKDPTESDVCCSVCKRNGVYSNIEKWVRGGRCGCLEFA